MNEPLSLEAALDLVQVEIAKHPADAIFAAAGGAQIALAERYNKKAIRSGFIGIAQRYTSGKDILKALDKRKLDIRECAIDILAVLDPPTAVRLAAAVATARVEPRDFAYEYERAEAFETLARSRASLALNRLTGSMSLDEILDGMARRVLSVDLAGAALASNPSLQCGADLVAALTRTQAAVATLEGRAEGPDRGFAEWLVARLVAGGHRQVAPLLARLHDSASGPLAQSAVIARAIAALGGAPAAPAAIAPLSAPSASPLPAPSRSAKPLANDWLERYLAGKHELVWAEVCATGLAAPEAQAQAHAVAAEMMGRVRQNLAMIVARLKDGGYRFRGRPLEAPAADVSATIAHIEKVAGGALPLSLRAFFEVVGAVDLRQAEHVDEETEEDPVVVPFPSFGEHDPLVIYPAISAASDIDAWHRSPSAQPRVVISVEADCKAVPKNGSDTPYRVALGGHVADATIDGMTGAPSFIAYLRSSLRWGGFAGLAPILDPLAPKSKAIAKKKRKTVDEWRLVYAERLVPDLLPF